MYMTERKLVTENNPNSPILHLLQAQQVLALQNL